MSYGVPQRVGKEQRRFMCTALGVYIGKKLSIKWIVIPFFMAGALAGFRNIFMMAKRIYSNKEKDAKKD